MTNFKCVKDTEISGTLNIKGTVKEKKKSVSLMILTSKIWFEFSRKFKNRFFFRGDNQSHI